jgi:hypothetical protein
MMVAGVAAAEAGKMVEKEVGGRMVEDVVLVAVAKTGAEVAGMRAVEELVGVLMEVVDGLKVRAAGARKEVATATSRALALVARTAGRRVPADKIVVGATSAPSGLRRLGGRSSDGGRMPWPTAVPTATPAGVLGSRGRASGVIPVGSIINRSSRGRS